MTDDELLSTLAYDSLTEQEQERAVKLACQRGQQTVKLLIARLTERGLPTSELPLVTLVTYVAYCVLSGKGGDKQSKEWCTLPVKEAIEDPRVYHFCHSYTEASREYFGLQDEGMTILGARLHTTSLSQRLSLLQKNYELIYSSALMSGRPEAYQPTIATAYEQMIDGLNQYCLSVMSLNAITDHWLGRV